MFSSEKSQYKNPISMHKDKFFDGNSISYVIPNESFVISEEDLGIEIIPVEFLIRELGIDINLLEPLDLIIDENFRIKRLFYLWRNLKMYIQNKEEYLKVQKPFSKVIEPPKKQFPTEANPELLKKQFSAEANPEPPKKQFPTEPPRKEISSNPISNLSIIPPLSSNPISVTPVEGENFNSISTTPISPVRKRRPRGPEVEVKKEILPFIENDFNPNIFPLDYIMYKYISSEDLEKLQGTKIRDFAEKIIYFNHFFQKTNHSEQCTILIEMIDTIKNLHKHGLIALTKDDTFGILIPKTVNFEKLPKMDKKTLDSIWEELKINKKELTTYKSSCMFITKFLKSKNFGVKSPKGTHISIIVDLINNRL